MLNRRSLISTAAAATALTPLLSGAEQLPIPAPMPTGSTSPPPIVLRVQSAYPDKELLNSFGKQWAELVNKISRGHIQIDYLSVGTVAKTTEVAGAVSDGKIDGCFTFPTYQGGYSPALNLWGTGPAFGMDSRIMTIWHEYGGGKELQAEIYQSKGLNLHNIAFMPIPTQPLGWANKPINKVSDFKGLKWRTSGLGGEMLEELGVSVKFYPGGEFVAALKKGEVDAGDFNNMTSDRLLGLNKAAAYCMVQSLHKASGCLELMINGKIWSSLSAEHRAILQSAASAMSTIGAGQMADRNSADYIDMANQGTTFLRTPVTVLQAQLNAWDRVLTKHSQKDPLFAKVAQSQREYAKEVTQWHFDLDVDYRGVFSHYFSRRFV